MTQIAFIGGGNMGFALAVGVRQARPEDTIVVADPIAAQRERFTVQGIATTAVNVEATEHADVVVFAVKPQIAEEVVKALRPTLDGKLVISIIAGTPLAKLNAWLGSKAAVIRCMPNTPALINLGITGMLSNDVATPQHRELAEAILAVCGIVVWFDSDDDLDKVTALSGSGPAYFFYVIEALVAAGENLGLARDTAMQLVSQTAVGAAAMASQSSGDPSQLRERVTSPGGTTEAALKCLNSEHVEAAFMAAIESAYRRAKELSK